MRVIDLHCDTLYKIHKYGKEKAFSKGHISDIKLKNGGYMAQCFAVYQPIDITKDNGLKHFNEQCRLYCKTVKDSKILRLACNKKDVIDNYKKNMVSAVLTVENLDFLQNDINNIKLLTANKVKIAGLIHNGENCIGFPHSADRKKALMPLKGFGKEVIEALGEAKITVDVSHLNVGGFFDVAKISKRPFVATHSCCRAVFDHSRNLDDVQIRAVALSGGVMGLNLYSLFLNGTDKTEVADVIRHLEHLINIGGEDVAAIGTDFDGMDCELFLKDASKIQTLCSELIKRFGFSMTEKICFKNALRIL